VATDLLKRTKKLEEEKENLVKEFKNSKDKSILDSNKFLSFGKLEDIIRS
jgi:hypothetical protein